MKTEIKNTADKRIKFIKEGVAHKLYNYKSMVIPSDKHIDSIYLSVRFAELPKGGYIFNIHRFGDLRNIDDDDLFFDKYFVITEHGKRIDVERHQIQDSQLEALKFEEYKQEVVGTE